MRLALLRDDETAGLLRLALASDGTAETLATELLRQEVSARAGSQRRFVVDRVCRLARPALDLQPDIVDELLEDLERSGDVAVADGGLVYPTPIRIVDLADGWYRFVSTLPTAALMGAVAGEWSLRGVRRDCRLAEKVEAVASALAGVAITADVWAGFDRVPAADEKWIAELQKRLAWAAQPAGSAERDEPLEWQGLGLTQGPKWSPSEEARLWRARHRWKGWTYAWTGGASPTATPFLVLHADEGTRTTHALARSCPAPIVATLARDGEFATLTIPVWIPQAEYRFLSTSGEAGEGGRGSQWRIPAARLGRVVEALKARLGLVIEEAQGA